ncbi:hypothetical protein BRADI_5g03758v3 [Brachypodium distachyon]|uniref:Uncharacterized protein n=1 Tax=Brachypodium distachyon TaxID=15368 RepID=A0A2K2CFD1_BRADI|nr:hypothetical protein BRADI_5g03758v3 [Brachypodium distachyon]
MILPRDLAWCPTISKLKTSELNKQCEYDNVTTLARFLQKITLLERLFLQLICPTSKVKTEVSYVTLGKSFLKGKRVVIKCRKIDAKVDEILKLLSDCSIPLCETSVK